MNTTPSINTILPIFIYPFIHLMFQKLVIPVNKRPKEVPFWEDDYWEDWRNERSDDGRSRLLLHHGAPPELRSEVQRLFPNPLPNEDASDSKTDTVKPCKPENCDQVDNCSNSKSNWWIGLLTLIVAIISLLWDHWDDVSSFISSFFL